jgi:hypothetical protein
MELPQILDLYRLLCLLIDTAVLVMSLMQVSKDQEKHALCRICSSFFTGGGWLAEKIRKFSNLKSSLD